jgi:asparagine synthetase B (glutamine-hydrolysing)
MQVCYLEKMNTRGMTRMSTLDSSPADRGQLDRLSASLGHREPNGSGVHVAEPVGRAHARLRIIDRQAGGTADIHSRRPTVDVL